MIRVMHCINLIDTSAEVALNRLIHIKRHTQRSDDVDRIVLLERDQTHCLQQIDCVERLGESKVAAIR